MMVSLIFSTIVIICTGNVKRHFSVVPLTQTNLTPYKTITEYNDRMECVMSCLHKSQTCSGFDWQGTNCTLYEMTCSVVEEWQQGNTTQLQKIMAHSGLQFSKNLSTKTGIFGDTWTVFVAPNVIRICEITISTEKMIQGGDSHSFYYYQGCYMDTGSRILSHQILTDSESQGNMTNSACINGCTEHGFAVAGTQYSTQCFCDDTFGDYVPVDEMECDGKCTGDTTQICGGIWRLSVWSNITLSVSVSGMNSASEFDWTLCTPSTYTSTSASALRLICDVTGQMINISTGASSMRIDASDINIVGWTVL